MKCDLCGGMEYKILFWGEDFYSKTTPKKFRLVRCKACGLVYLNPPPSEEDLRYAYPENYDPHKDERLSKNGADAKISAQKDKERKTFLDFGCGSGKLLERMRSKHPNWELFGYETDERAVRRAEAKGFKIYSGKFDEIGFEENMFDFVVMRHVLEHLRSPKDTLLEIKKVMKPGGTLSITLPNFGGLSIKIFRSKAFILEIPRHLFHFAPRTLRKLLEKEGFKITKIKFESSSKTLARSIGLVLGKSWHKPPALLTQIMRPISKAAEILKMSDIFSVTAEKPRT